MCGRFAIAHPRFEKIEAALGVAFAPLSPRYNIAPTARIPAVRRTEAGGYAMTPMRWGLVPHWSKEPTTKFSTFNARVESAEKKPAFRDSFRRRRCLIPASGFYEWKTLGGGRKEPYYFTDAAGAGLVFAGLWDRWSGEAGEELLSCTILVGAPNALLSEVHDRMPVILPEAALALWLDPAAGAEALRPLLVPYPAEGMRGWPVAAAVGNPRNDGPALLEPLG